MKMIRRFRVTYSSKVDFCERFGQNMRKKLLLVLFLLLLTGCDTVNLEGSLDYSEKADFSLSIEEFKPAESSISTATSEVITEAVTIVTTATSTITTKDIEATTTTVREITDVFENMEEEINEISCWEWEGKNGCTLTLRRPLSEEDLHDMLGVTIVNVSLSESVDLSKLVRLAPLEKLQIEYDQTDEPYEIGGLNNLLCADISEIYISGNGHLLDLSGVRNETISTVFLVDVVLKSNHQSAFPNLIDFIGVEIGFEEESPFLPFASAKKVYLNSCNYKNVNSISAFSEVEDLTIMASDISELNVLQELPKLSKVTLWSSVLTQPCSIYALENLEHINYIAYQFSLFAEPEEALLREWYPDCCFHVLYGI